MGPVETQGEVQDKEMGPVETQGVILRATAIHSDSPSAA
jgi:hypothetical protein